MNGTNNNNLNSCERNKTIVAVGKKNGFEFNWRSVLFILIAGILIYTLVPQLLGVRQALVLLEKANKLKTLMKFAGG